MKRYFLILLMVFGVGLITTPNVSTAKEPEVNFDEIVEITNLTELEPISEIKIEDIAEDAQITTPVYATKATTSTTVNFSYTVTQKTNSIVENPSNSDIYKTGKLVYAHNDPSLMLSALSLSKGFIFTITENGITKTYQVAETEIFAKTDLQAIIPGTKRNYMSEVTYSAKNPNTGKTHNLALMTCYERTRGATHRFVVFANEI